MRRLCLTLTSFVCLGAGLMSCRDIVGLEFPSNAVRVAPPAEYGFWWAMVGACAGISRDMKNVRWYTVPDSVILWFDGEPAAGIWYESGNRVVVHEDGLHSGRLFRHEMLHSVLHEGSHLPNRRSPHVLNASSLPLPHSLR